MSGTPPQMHIKAKGGEGKLASVTISGQSSRGYEKLSQLSRMGYEPGLASWEHTKSSDERNAAAELLRKRRRKTRLEW